MTAPHAAVGLVARDGPHERIGRILSSEGFALAAVDDAPANGAADAGDDISAVVLWVDGPISDSRAPIEALARRHRRSGVVVVCESGERWEIRAALASGAAGVVLQGAIGSCLGPCVRAVQVGQLCVPRARWQEVHPPALSTREKQILGLVVMGCTNGQIAHRLVLAESTVKSHLSSAFAKLGVRSRNEAVDLIIDPERGLGVGILGIGAYGERAVAVVTP
jgi:DNA-binding NarL/FixJ family response regulator